MLVGIKDAAKLVGILIITCCAVMVCTMFLNYYMDVTGIEDEIASEQVMVFYRAQVATAKVVCGVSGGCMLITSVVMLLFYIKHYIDVHKKELGILKALGQSDISVAGNFWVFGFSVLFGAALGFAGAFLLMPLFYEVQNKDKILPDFSVQFHPILLLFLVVIPAAAFAALAALRRRTSAAHTARRAALQADPDPGTFFGQCPHGPEAQFCLLHVRPALPGHAQAGRTRQPDSLHRPHGTARGTLCIASPLCKRDLLDKEGAAAGCFRRPRGGMFRWLEGSVKGGGFLGGPRRP